MRCSSSESWSFAAAVPHKETAAIQYEATRLGTPLWADRPELRIKGTPAEQEFRTVVHPLGRVAIVGQCPATDTELQTTLRQALDRQQPEILSNLPGNYTAMLFDHHPGLTVVGSLAGTQSIYYAQSAEQTIVSSAPHLAASESLLQPDILRAATHFLIPDAEGSLFGNDSSIKGVSKLRGGQILRVHPESIRVETYDALLPDHTASFEEAAIAFGIAFQKAVIQRVQEGITVSADLSGGVDSGSIVSLLAQHSQGKTLPVSFAAYSRAEDGDGRFVQHLLHQYPQMRMHTFDASDIAAYSFRDFEQTPWPEDLALANNMSPRGWEYVNRYYREHVGGLNGKADSRLHFIGSGGDEVAGIGPFYMVDLLRNQEIRRFLREGMSWARILNLPAWQVWQDLWQLGRTTPSEAIKGLTSSLGAPSSPPNVFRMWQTIGPGTMWLTGKARREVADFLMSRASELELPEGFSIGDYMTWNSLHGAGHGAAMLKHYLAVSGSSVSLQTPFLDNNVVRAAFALPAYKRGSPYIFKKILHQALSGVVPAEILERRTKGAYDKPHYQALRGSLAAFRQLANNSYLADLGIVEPDRIHETLDKIDNESLIDKQPLTSIWALHQLMAAEGWLRSPHLSKATQPRPSQGIHLRHPVSTSQTTAVSSFSKPLPSYVAMPTYVHVLSSSSGSIVLFNRRTDMYHPIDHTRSNMLRALAGSADFEAALRTLQSMYPSQNADQIRSDTARCLEELIGLGVVEASDQPSIRHLPKRRGIPRFVSGEAAVAHERQTAPQPITNRIGAAAAFALSGLIQHTSPSIKLPFLQYIQRKWCNGKSSLEEAQQMLRSAQSLPHLGRLACVEASYAAALATALVKRKTLPWHQGVSFDPLAFHAWVEVEGEPVRTELDGRVTGAFESFFA